MGGSEIQAWRSHGLNALPSRRVQMFLNMFLTGMFHHENQYYWVFCVALPEASVMSSSLRITQPPSQWMLEELWSQAWLCSALLASASRAHALSPVSPAPCGSWQNSVQRAFVFVFVPFHQAFKG